MSDPSFVTGSPETAGPPLSSDSDESGRGVHHLGYRGWSGRTAPGWMRWTVISVVGVRRSWQSTWLRRTLFFAWLPTLWFGLGFFMWEQAVLHPEWRRQLSPFLRTMPPTAEFEGLREALRTGDLEGSRHLVWGWLLQTFFRHPQGVLMVILIGMISPPLISQDIRSRAFLLYFSRPLTRGEYILGKAATLWIYLSLISTLPALSLYVIGILLSPTLDVTFATWDIPIRILVASLVLMLPTSVLALAMSSLTQESRYAGFAWFAVWVLGWFTFGAATSVEAFNASMQQAGPMVLDNSPWTHLSLYHTLGRVQRWVFGFANFSDVAVSLVILVSVTIVSLAILVRRISAPMRI